MMHGQPSSKDGCDTDLYIEHFINTSYDTVKKVADNLDLINKAGDYIDTVNNSLAEIQSSLEATANSEYNAIEAANRAADASRLTVGTVSTLAPGTPATMDITGVAGAQKLSLGIPQGPVGLTGPIGPVGPTGPIGPTGPAGSGSGNVQRNSTVPDGAMTVFDGTTGTYIKPAAVSGIVKLVGGVPIAAEPGTDYLEPTGTAQYATKLFPGAKINGVTFTGEMDITVLDGTKQPVSNALTKITQLETAGHPGFPRYLGSNSWIMDNTAYLTENQTINVSGDATGSGSTNITLTLSNVGTASTYAGVTTDDKGRVISGVATLPVASGGTGAITAEAAFGNLKQNATTSTTGVVQLVDSRSTLGPDVAACLTPNGLKLNQIQRGIRHGYISSGVTLPLLTYLEGGVFAVVRWKRITVALYDAKLYGQGTAYLRLNGQINGYEGAGVRVAGTNTVLARTDGHPIYLASNNEDIFGGTATILYIGYDSNIEKHVYSISSVIAGSTIANSQSIIKLSSMLASIELYSNAAGGSSAGFNGGSVELIWE